LIGLYGFYAVAYAGSVFPNTVVGTLSAGGMDAEDKLPASDSTDDLLDIPAFLRRQAN